MRRVKDQDEEGKGPGDQGDPGTKGPGHQGIRGTLNYFSSKLYFFQGLRFFRHA